MTDPTNAASSSEAAARNAGNDVNPELAGQRATGSNVPNNPLENRNTRSEVISRSTKRGAAVDAGLAAPTGTGDATRGAVSTPAETSWLAGGTSDVGTGGGAAGAGSAGSSGTPA